MTEVVKDYTKENISNDLISSDSVLNNFAGSSIVNPEYLTIEGNTTTNNNTVNTVSGNISANDIRASAGAFVNLTANKLSAGNTTLDNSSFIKSNNFQTGVTGFKITADGAEFNDGVFRGTITAEDGVIGGWTIGTTSLYATTTGTIKTSVDAGAGYNGVVIDKDGIRVYDSLLGEVVNLPSDGSAPTFSSGIINEVTFEISTNSVLRTSDAVGDGTADSAGILINNSGIYACGANQTPSTANVRILNDGGGRITLGDTGYIQGGQTDFATGDGFFLGYSGDIILG